MMVTAIRRPQLRAWRLWHAGGVTDASAQVDQLVGDWLTVPDIAERYDLRLSQARRLIDDREVVGIRRGERSVLSVPARFFDDEGPIPPLRGTLTVLTDSGLTDDEIIGWLFTPDETLPLPGAPIDNLLGGRKTEIRRRAMELAY